MDVEQEPGQVADQEHQDVAHHDGSQVALRPVAVVVAAAVVVVVVVSVDIGVAVVEGWFRELNRRRLSRGPHDDRRRHRQGRASDGPRSSCGDAVAGVVVAADGLGDAGAVLVFRQQSHVLVGAFGFECF